MTQTEVAGVARGHIGLPCHGRSQVGGQKREAQDEEDKMVGSYVEGRQALISAVQVLFTAGAVSASGHANLSRRLSA